MHKFRLAALTILLCFALFIPAGAQDDETTGETRIAAPRPAPSITATDGRANLSLYFESLPQGSTGVAYLTGADISSARMRFLGELVDFYRGDDGYYVLIPVGLDVTPRAYPMSIAVQYADGVRGAMDTSVTVTQGGFLRQAFSVPTNLAYLTAPEIERNEYARLGSIFAESSPDKLWGDDGFILPMDTEITSPFGSFRTLNQNTQTRHTGWDFRAVPGTPVKASAGGIIAFAGPMDIRGNYVVIDHGFGVFSGYAHFSQILVSEGQTVQQGQIIGASGNTGRSSGPHLHWEIAVNGEWVDSVAFTQMWLP